MIPVHDPIIGNHGLTFCGLGACSQLISKTGDSELLWNHVCKNDWFDKLLANNNTGNLDIASVLNNPEGTVLPYQDLDIMDGLYQKHQLKVSIKYKINQCIHSQKKAIGQNINILGVAAGGSFSKFPIASPGEDNRYDICPPNSSFWKMNIETLKSFASMDNQIAQKVLAYRLETMNFATSGFPTVATYLFQDWDAAHKLYVYGADVFAEGASIAACCVGEKLPAYRIKLLPLHIYSIGKNERGDKVQKWPCLVSDDTLEAGQSYLQPNPIEGLAIPVGAKLLELTLRRPSHGGKQLYKSVTATIPVKTEQTEPVRITANVRPGQGFAKVNIESKRLGIFSTRLDWKTMKSVDKPVLFLEYIPDAAFIVSDSTLWYNARIAIEYFNNAWEKYQRVYKTNTDNLLTALIQFHE